MKIPEIKPSQVFIARIDWMLLAGILTFSPKYFSYFHKIGLTRFIAVPDPLFWLGAVYLAACLFQHAIPVVFFERLCANLKRHATTWLAAALTISFLSLYLVNQKVLHSFLSSADEFSCYFLARCLHQGKLWVHQHPLWEFFKTVHVGNRDGKWFSVYPLGWPLLYSLGLRLQIQDFLNPLLSTTALAFLFLSLRRLFDAGIAVAVVVLTAITPFYCFTSASYFSHSTCLLMMTIFLYAFLRWKLLGKSKTKTRWAGLAALALGYGLNTRYLSMAAFVAPFLIHELWQTYKKKVKWSAEHTLFASITGLFVLAILGHNFLVTGRPFEAPNHYDKHWERLGFKGDYSMLEGLQFIIARFTYLMDWASSWWGVLFIVSLFQKKEETALKTLVRFSFLSFPAAYFFYYSWGGNQWGPRYYYEGFPFLIAALVIYLRSSWPRLGMTGKKFLIALMIFSLIDNGCLFVKQVRFYEEASRQRKALYDLAEETLHQPSIVFIHGFLGKALVLGEEDAVRNPPDLKNLILYAHDLDAKNETLKQYYPQHHYYRGSYDADANRPVLEPI